jgi:UDP-N-acetylmuramyl pentapeptide phosphotransferase/UDP-N-acetylglucosamine-1-phosphate transferase
LSKLYAGTDLLPKIHLKGRRKYTVNCRLGFSVLFTAIAIGGIANAINMIDGLNRLASSMMVIALVRFMRATYLVAIDSPRSHK